MRLGDNDGTQIETGMEERRNLGTAEKKELIPRRDERRPKRERKRSSKKIGATRTAKRS